MLFTSLDFAWFLPCVFLLYWGLGANRLKTQNFILLVASYVFYGWWDWRFLLLLFCSSVLDFTVGLGLGRLTNPKHRKMLLGGQHHGEPHRSRLLQVFQLFRGQLCGSAP
jgi:alginate O-acetyltransferase complex protein AlgI